MCLPDYLIFCTSVWLLLSFFLYSFVIIVFLFLEKWFSERVFLLFAYGICDGGDSIIRAQVA